MAQRWGKHNIFKQKEKKVGHGRNKWLWKVIFICIWRNFSTDNYIKALEEAVEEMKKSDTQILSLNGQCQISLDIEALEFHKK